MASARDLQALLASAENTAALEAIYDRTVKRVLEELAGGVSQPGAGRARDLLIRLRQLAADIDPTKDSKVRRWIRKELPKAFILGDKAAAKEVKKALQSAAAEDVEELPELNRSFTPVNALQLRTLAAVMSDKLSAVHRQVLETAGLVVRRTQLAHQQNQEIREHIVGGIVRGAAGRKVSNDIARAILTGKVSPDARERMAQAGFAGEIELYKQLARGELITVGKRRFNVRAYANLVAKTMSREAATKAAIVRLQQNNVGHVRISSPQQAVADVCTAYAGKVFWVGPGEDPDGFPPLRSILNGGPPFHPNCRHTVEAYVVPLKTKGAVETQRKLSERLVKDGLVGATPDKIHERVKELGEEGLREISKDDKEAA